jgi:hypothetical protein
MPPVRSTRELPETEREAIEKTPLLIHSLSQFGEVTRQPLDIVAPRRIVEIGGEGAGFTVVMAEWAERNGAELITIDPEPSGKLRELAEHHSSLTLFEGLSPDALEKVKPADLYVIDGDHNYHVVRAELEAILSATADRREDVLCITHDVGYPCARRDFYYGPERLPPEAVQPHSFTAGLISTDHELHENRGYRGMGMMAIARHSGGPANGVLTAVEDAIAARQGLELQIVPAIFGLGFLFPSKALWAGRLRDFLTPLATSELVAALEHNRMALYLALLDVQDELARRTARYNLHLSALEDQLAAATGEQPMAGASSGGGLRVDSEAGGAAG